LRQFVVRMAAQDIEYVVARQAAGDSVLDALAHDLEVEDLLGLDRLAERRDLLLDLVVVAFREEQHFEVWGGDD